MIAHGFRRQARLFLGGLVLLPSVAWAQGTPLPLPSEPGGARPPVYTQPQPSTTPGTAPAPGEPAVPRPAPGPLEPARSAAPPSPTTTGAAKPESPQESKVPQLTSFPELTRGVGNSEDLLQE